MEICQLRVASRNCGAVFCVNTFSVEKMTDGAIKLTPGTMYGSLSKMEKDHVIRFIREDDKRKLYQITDLGLEVLQIELKRIERLYKIAQEEM